MTRWMPFDLDALEADFTTTFTNELDYIKEATFCETFQRNLLMNMRVDIPKIYWDFTTKRVLTMEFMDGTPIDDLAALDEAGVDRKQLALDLAHLYIAMILDDGFFHADPHPGNVLVRGDGIIQLIDFGMVGSITAEARSQYTQLIMALTQRDADAIVRAFKDLGFLGPGADTAALTQMVGPYVDSFVGEMAGFFTDASLVDALMTGDLNFDLDLGMLDQMRQFIYTQPINLPGDVTFLGKALITVLGLCLRLDPEMDLAATASALMTSRMPTAQEVASQVLTSGLSMLRNIVPNARRIVAVAKKLEAGTLEVEISRTVERRLIEAQAKQTRRLMGTVVLAAGAIIVTIIRRR